NAQFAVLPSRLYEGVRVTGSNDRHALGTGLVTRRSWIVAGKKPGELFVLWKVARQTARCHHGLWNLLFPDLHVPQCEPGFRGDEELCRGSHRFANNTHPVILVAAAEEPSRSKRHPRIDNVVDPRSSDLSAHHARIPRQHLVE